MTGVDPKGLEAATKTWFGAQFDNFSGEHLRKVRNRMRGAITAYLAVAALTPLKGDPVAWANDTDEWFLALDCEDNVCCATQDHGEAIAALSRLHDYERGRIERLVPAPEAEVCSASQPLPETEGKRSAPFDTSISAETKAQLAAIDDNIRAAVIQAPNTFFGSGSTLPATKGVTDEMVEALRAAESELMRLRRIFLPEYEGKIGEPKAAVLAKISAALSLPAPGEEAGPVGWAYQDARWIDEGRWHLCMTEPRALENRTIKRVYLEGALSPTAPELPVKVKPIEWVRRPIIGGEDRIMSYDGYYWLSRASDGFMVIGEDGIGHAQRLSGTVYPTEDAAQAAAQQHFESRILSALVRPATQNDQPETDEMQPDKYTGGDFNGVVRGKRP